jgi:hypothetical protein
MLLKKYLPIINTIFILLFLTKNSYASTPDDFFTDSTITGTLRTYDFSRDYSKSGRPSQNSFSAGGELDALSAPFWSGVQLGGSFYTAQSLGLNSTNHQHLDNTLPGYTINTLGQAYIQYQTHNKNYLIRIGNQLINTPWLGPSDSRMIPATYQGIYTSYSPINDLIFIGLRVFKFKARIADNFSDTNLYNPNNGGSTSINAFDNTSTPGALAFGARYALSNLTTQAWYYKFYNLANMAYVDSNYKFSTTKDMQPIFGIQLLRERGDGDNILQSYTGGKANSMGIGGLIGIETTQTRTTLSYNKIYINNHAFEQGNVLSPYTSGYSSDPLYTTSMIAGLIEKASGQAIKLNSSYYTFNRQLQLTASYAKYFTAPRLANTNEVDFDASYKFAGTLKGFVIRNRIGVLNGMPNTGRFIYNRVMLQYSF